MSCRQYRIARSTSARSVGQIVGQLGIGGAGGGVEVGRRARELLDVAPLVQAEALRDRETPRLVWAAMLVIESRDDPLPHHRRRHPSRRVVRQHRVGVGAEPRKRLSGPRRADRRIRKLGLGRGPAELIDGIRVAEVDVPDRQVFLAP